MKLYFLTFAAPLDIYSDALNRIKNQAEKFNMFNEIIIENEYTLMNNHKEFWEKHKNFIENNTRGYGFWLWKPYLINYLLNKMGKDDILLYCDVGCELNYKCIDNFNRLLNMVKIQNIIGFSGGSNDIIYTKRDLSAKYNLHHNLLALKHLQAGCLLIKYCDLSKIIINEWYINCEIYNNIDDTQSKLPNFNTFIEHRHDQSVLNMVLKKYRIINRYYCDILSSDRNIYSSPILYIRNKTGKSILNH